MTNKVTGPRSPRWALMRKTTIYCGDGLVYLVRWRLVQTPWFGVYLHDLLEPDDDRAPHDHPFTFVSIILRGGYTEQFHPLPWVLLPKRRTQTWGRWSAHRMGTESAHIITDVEPRTKTLILTGRRRRDWGFHTEDGWVPWQEYA